MSETIPEALLAQLTAPDSVPSTGRCDAPA